LFGRDFSGVSMAGGKISRRLAGVLLLALAEVAVGLTAAVTTPAAAQQFDDRFPFLFNRRNNNQGSFFGFPDDRRPVATPRAAPVVENNTRAPPPTRKSDTEPLTSVIVLGDSMADWLAYGLEQAAADSPDIGILRRHRSYSGLIRIEVKNDPKGEYPDWPQAARDMLAADKANFVVMMVGLNDRRPIREKAPTKTATTPATPQVAPAAPAATATPATPPGPPANKDGEKDNERDTASNEAPAEAPAAPGEGERVVAGMVTYEFRSDKWTELYIKRIDDTIAALKAKNVPVFWVGLPPVRNPKISADLSYLNDLYRSRAEKAGITYIDTWDGFVDESGRFVMSGPDFEGQTRRLRSGDGVHFTEAGARKLAHYVEREIQRALMANATPVTLPATDEPAAAPAPAAPRPGSAVARPLAGPVMPLTTPAEANELAGGANARQAATDAIASKVLVRGEPNRVPAGRADDFVWPRRPVAAPGIDPVVATTTTPMTPMQPFEPRQVATAAPAAPGPAGPAAPVRRVAPVRQAAANPRPATSNQPAPNGYNNGYNNNNQQQARRIAPQQQPFFFPFFGR
jgi:hypothetical protein